MLLMFVAVLIFSATMLALHYIQEVREEKELKRLAAIAAYNTPPASPGWNIHEITSIQPPTQTTQKTVMLEQYRELYEQNMDMAGWIKIDGTEINYPVMYTPEDGEFYLSHGFDKEESKSGLPFIDKRCTAYPFGTNTIIYGHHMKNGTMFAGLLNYEDEGFYAAHPTIRFHTLYERREYEIIAVFRGKVFRKGDTDFKHYNFLNAEDAVAFAEYIANIKELSLYNTGVTASYGDELLTLSTCAYHVENGQFVVVARKT
jgi:sortase B